MTSARHGLGRGLSALIPGAPVPVATSPMPAGGRAVLVVPPERIHANPRQPRRTFATEELQDLASSIQQHGILQPIVVTLRPDGAYELIAGERRLRAARLAGLATVPVIVREGTHDERTKLELALIENVQRQDLNPIDRAVAYRELLNEFGLTQEAVSTRVGVSRSAVAHAMRILTLPSEMQDAVRDGKVSEGHAKVLAGIESPAEQRAWFERILTQRIPVAAVAAAQPKSTRAGGARTAASPLDPNLRAKEAAIRERLGARVRITPRGRGGAIAIDYSDAEELQGIVQTITRVRG